MSETNAKLASEKEELVKIVEDNEAQIKSLQVQLSLKSNEKAAFDHAVSRLHDDLFKVETGFHKIRKEMVQKVCSIGCINLAYYSNAFDIR